MTKGSSPRCCDAMFVSIHLLKVENELQTSGNEGNDEDVNTADNGSLLTEAP